MKYLPTDSVCFHDETDRDLFKQQKKLWRPMWRWVENNYGYSLDVVDGIKATNHPTELADAMKADVEAMDTWRLTALQVGQEPSHAQCVGILLHDIGLRRNYFKPLSSVHSTVSPACCICLRSLAFPLSPDAYTPDNDDGV